MKFYWTPVVTINCPGRWFGQRGDVCAVDRELHQYCVALLGGTQLWFNEDKLSLRTGLDEILERA